MAKRIKNIFKRLLFLTLFIPWIIIAIIMSTVTFCGVPCYITFIFLIGGDDYSSPDWVDYLHKYIDDIGDRIFELLD